MCRCRTSPAGSRRGRRRKHLDSNLLPGLERDRTADERLVFFAYRPQTLLHGVRRALYSQLVSVRPGAEPGMLILFRVMQGVGGGGLQPSEQSILVDTFPPEKRGMAFAVYGMAVVVAPAIGPTLGGWITDNFSWRWIFFINVPVGIISLLLTSRDQDPPHLSGARREGGMTIDYIGLGLLALGLGALQVVLDKGQREDWLSSHMILSLTASLPRRWSPSSSGNGITTTPSSN